MQGTANVGESPQREALLSWSVPVAYGGFVYAVVRLHSHAPARTLPALAWTLCILGVVSLLLLAAKGRRLTISRPTGWILFALAASMLASNVLLSDLFWSAPLFGVYVGDVLIALAIFLWYREASSIPLRHWCVVLALVHVPFVVDAVMWVADTGPPFFQRSNRIVNFSHVRQFGEMGFVAAVCGSALMVLSSRLRLVSFLLSLAAVFGMVLTGSRGALLCWILFMALLWTGLPAARRMMAVNGATVLGLSVAVVGILHYCGWLVSPNVFARIETIVDGDAGFDSGRLVIWLDALEEIAKRPLFGLGTEAYQLSGCCDRMVAQPHNVVLQLLMQFGFVGNALLVALAWRAILYLGGVRVILARVCATPEATVLASMIAAYTAYAMIDGVLYHPAPMLYLSVFCGLLSAVLMRSADRKISGQPQ